MLRRLRRAGIRTYNFGHWVCGESYAAIVARLAQQLARVAAAGDYVLIGHSLGGVLLREALAALPPATHLPTRLFLLGSPIQVSSVAVRMADNPLYRLLTGDCGRVLGSRERMAAIGAPAVPVTAVIGVKGWSLVSGLLPPGAHDGVVTANEASAPWLTDVVRMPVNHTFMPTDSRVTALILERLQR
jgi:pimeloyl-ACP methyl ester carboxylesterase